MKVPCMLLSRLFYWFVLLGVVLLVVPEGLAQFKGRTPPARQMPDRLDQESGEALLESFRGGQGVGVFGYKFELEERPYRDSSWQLSGRLYGHWFGDPYWSRLEIDQDSGEAAVWLLRNGREPAIWKWQDDRFREVEPANWNNPLIDGSSVTIFDLLMPYIHWQESEYLGPTRHLGRPIQRFLLQNPIADAEPAVVEAYIDEAFFALLQVRSYDAEGDELRRWQAASFRRAGEDWTLGRLDLSDRQSRSSTRLRFTHYLEYPNLDTSGFRPESSLPQMDVPSEAWERL